MLTDIRICKLFAGDSGNFKIFFKAELDLRQEMNDLREKTYAES